MIHLSVVFFFIIAFIVSAQKPLPSGKKQKNNFTLSRSRPTPPLTHKKWTPGFSENQKYPPQKNLAITPSTPMLLCIYRVEDMWITLNARFIFNRKIINLKVLTLLFWA